MMENEHLSTYHALNSDNTSKVLTVADIFPIPSKLQEDPTEYNANCNSMIYFQLVVFVLFYVSLIVIIICMYVKYRRECREMQEDSSTDYRMVRRLMDQYD